jgi:hypothetical protein
MPNARRYRAGESIEDYCRACKTDRMHTVMAASADGDPIRVVCDYCRSEHNYRGGPRIAAGGQPYQAIREAVTGRAAGPDVESTPRASAGTASPQRAPAAQTTSGPARGIKREPFPLVSERERTASSMAIDQDTDLELLLRRIIREEAGLTAVTPADKWRGGSLVLRPGTPGLQEKTWPIETFFHKIVMLRNRLRTLEQHVNASELPDDVKVKLQGYITGCYGSLTSFNVLFADESDQFKGSGGE